MLSTFCLLLTDLSFFEKVLALYHSQQKEALTIPQRRNLGLLLVDKTELKEKLVQSPLQCLEVRNTVAAILHLCSQMWFTAIFWSCETLFQVINEMLTQLARRRVDATLAETIAAQVKLEFSPSTTAELANYLVFLEQIQEKVCDSFSHQLCY